MLSTILISLIPIAILLGLGNYLKHQKMLEASFWSQAEKLGYYILLPSLFIHSLSSANLAKINISIIAQSLLFPLFITSVILVCIKPLIKIDNPSFTSIFQGGIRFNNVVGVTITVGVFGTSAIAMTAIVNAILIPIINILCILIFAKFSDTKTSLKKIARSIFCNPLVLGCLIGIGFLLGGIHLPPGIEQAVKALGQASLPLGLLCVGSALNLSAIVTEFKPTIIASMFKLILMPTFGIITCYLLKTDAIISTIIIIFLALPTAPSSYVMARQLGGNAPLMANMIALQTIMTFIILPILLSISPFMSL